MTAKQKVAESGVLRACLDLLAAEKVWHRRWNTGAVKTGNRFFRFGEKGDADIFATPMCLEKFTNDSGSITRCVSFIAIPLWIECKSDSGHQSEDQKAFQAEVLKAGHEYLLVRDIDTLWDWLKAHGATR